MDFKELLKAIKKDGVSFGVMVVLLWQLFNIQGRLLETISNNTAAINRFSYIVDSKCR